MSYHDHYVVPRVGVVKPHITRERTHRGSPYWACNMYEGMGSVRGVGDTPKEAFDSWRACRKQAANYLALRYARNA